ncbi:MAG TPA: hypothetical protein VH572_12270 [Gaiella sp.]
MKKLTVLAVVVAMLAIAPLAAAGSSVLSGYGTSGSKPVVQVKGTTSSATPTASGATLPFTGVDLLLITGAGVALIGVGAGLRRLGRDKS